MPWNSRYQSVVLTGPESTGKTTLARELADVSGGLYIPEYARTYVERLARPYHRDDVEHIARTQVRRYAEAAVPGKRPLVFDTFLIITKIWFVALYGAAPAWIDSEIRRNTIDMFLLCYPDLPWVPDPVRENPGKRRMELFQAYRRELEQAGLRFRVVKGVGKIRIQNCLRLLEDNHSGRNLH